MSRAIGKYEVIKNKTEGSFAAHANEETVMAMLTDLNDTQRAFLLTSAKHYIWWKTPEEAMEYPHRILVQVMNIGLIEDMGKVIEYFSEKDLINILNTAEIGQFNERSWAFWHNRFSLEIPPMPVRKFGQ